MEAESTKVINIKQQNRVKTVTKLSNGDLRVEQYSGDLFDVSKDDVLFQSFAVYSVLADL